MDELHFQDELGKGVAPIEDIKSAVRNLILALILCCHASAQDFRKWTQAETKKVIEGTITDKKSDSSSAKIVTTDDRTFWLEAKTLIPEDREFIRRWIDPGGRLSVKVVASGKGWKELKVTFQSGASPLEVQAYDQWPHRKKGPRRVIKPGESGEFIYKAHNVYRVVATSEGKEVDRETDKEKTGL